MPYFDGGWVQKWAQFVYAPFQDRVRRLRARMPTAISIEHQPRTTDEERAKYIHQRFGSNWRDTHLYNLMLSSDEDEDKTARVTLYAMSEAEQKQSTALAIHTK
jgi:cytidylate kinase